MNNKTKFIIALLCAFAVGFGVSRMSGSSGQSSSAGAGGASEAAPTIWTCSMHPEIQLPDPGLCPKCQMDLIPLSNGSGGSSLGPRTVQLSEHAQALAQVQTTPVKRQVATKRLRLVGKVHVDETREYTITSRFRGRLDRLYVDYTGIKVRTGDHLYDIYSPTILTAQEEYLQAKRNMAALAKQSSRVLHKTAAATLEATREKLRLLGMTDKQISGLGDKTALADHLTLYSPVSGTVMKKYVRAGQYVNEGDVIYTIADLSTVWAKLDVYESDVAWLRFGQAVDVSVEAYPGEVFHGVIAFINPTVDPRTRTIAVRINLANPERQLKPDMFARAEVLVSLLDDNRVINDKLKGKWISPMHPEIVKDGPGACDRCGMALVKAETLGYVTEKAAEELLEPLVIPASAALITGKRAVVYVAVPGEAGAFEGRDVVLGARVDQGYIVQEGLFEGETVVTNGAFRLDSALQIVAKPSMMNPIAMPNDSSKSHSHGHAHSSSTIPKLITQYLAMQKALSRDDLKSTIKAANAFIEIPVQAPLSTQFWNDVGLPAIDITDATDLATARASFLKLSTAMVREPQLQQFSALPLTVFECSMAFDNAGGQWLQTGASVENPYYGSAMFRCGVSKGALIKQAQQGPSGKPSGSHDGSSMKGSSTKGSGTKGSSTKSHDGSGSK